MFQTIPNIWKNNPFMFQTTHQIPFTKHHSYAPMVTMVTMAPRSRLWPSVKSSESRAFITSLARRGPGTCSETRVVCDAEQQRWMCSKPTKMWLTNMVEASQKCGCYQLQDRFEMVLYGVTDGSMDVFQQSDFTNWDVGCEWHWGLKPINTDNSPS